MGKLTTIHVMSAGPGFGNWSAAEGVRRYLPASIPSVDFRSVDCSGVDVMVIGGGGFVHSEAEPFWRRVADSECRVVLWGLGACHHLTHTGTGGKLRPLDPRIMDRIKPRIVLAAVRDAWTRDLYGLDAEVLFCPTVKALEGVEARRSDATLYAHHPGLVGEAESKRTAGLCDLFTDHTESPQRVIRLHASAGLCVASRLHGAIVSRALGVPYVALARDRKTVEFVRQWGGGLLVHDAPRRLPGAGSIPQVTPISTAGNDRFAERALRLIGGGR